MSQQHQKPFVPGAAVSPENMKMFIQHLIENPNTIPFRNALLDLCKDFSKKGYNAAFIGYQLDTLSQEITDQLVAATVKASQSDNKN